MLERLVAGYEQHQDLTAAIYYAQHVLRLDPLQETRYLQLMRLPLNRTHGMTAIWIISENKMLFF